MSLDHSPVQQGDAKPVYTVAEFCSAHRISRSKLYQLWLAGEGPRVIVVGTRKLISTEAAAAWRSTREGEYVGGPVAYAGKGTKNDGGKLVEATI
jgi:hypothetical protein